MFSDYSITFNLQIDTHRNRRVFRKVRQIRKPAEIELNNEVEAAAIFMVINKAGIKTPTESGHYKVSCDYNYINDEYHIESASITGVISTGEPFEYSTHTVEHALIAISLFSVAAIAVGTFLIHLQ